MRASTLRDPAAIHNPLANETSGEAELDIFWLIVL
jgi:hypothetical protein